MAYKYQYGLFSLFHIDLTFINVFLKFHIVQQYNTIVSDVICRQQIFPPDSLKCPGIVADVTNRQVSI